MTTRIEVDFNSRDDAGMVPAPIEDADGPLRVGDQVEAYDDEGYRCLAIVATVAGEFVALDPVWRAFVSPDQPRIVLTLVPSTMWADWKNALTLALTRLSSPAPEAITSEPQAALA